jgi:hypothetical protein
MGEPLPEGDVEFIIVGHEMGREFDLPVYAYLLLTYTIDNIKVTQNRNHINYRYITTLNDYEISELFEKYGEDAYGNKNHYLKLSILQKADIEKINRQMYSKDVNIPAEEHVKYGVELNPKHKVITSFNGQPVADSNTFDYQNGLTIVLPVFRGKIRQRNLFYNLNNPAVQEYCARVAVKTRLLYKTHLFLDEYGIIGRLRGAVRKSYFCDGDKADNIEHYANRLAQICKDIKKRADNVEIIANCFLPRYTKEEKGFLETLTNQQNISGFDGFMSEDIFGPYGYNSKDMQWFLEWMEYLDERNIKLLLAASNKYLTDNKNSRFAENFHLFANLIARDNLYLWYSSTTYKSMIDYNSYKIELGKPKSEKPEFNNNVWIRNYEKGKIFLDTSKKGYDALWLEEAQ